MDEIRVLSPTAILGYGFPMASFEAGIERKPHVIAVDAGSTDPGPYYLGSGNSFTDRTAVKRDLEAMLIFGRKLQVPVIVGTAGGSGADSHLQWCLEIIREIASEQGLSFKLAVIQAEIPKEQLLQNLERGEIKPLPPGKELSRDDLEKATRVVGQMGVEPFIKALDAGAEVILAGRAYDPAVFAAFPVREGFDKGLALHMGKILECASIAATPGSGSDCMMGYLRKDHFVLEPLNPIRKCTTTSVAAHTLYEKTNPFILPGPGGTLDLTATTFEQLDERTVKVAGTKFIPANPYTIKLEGAKLVGYRTVSIAGARDPIFIDKVEEIIQGVRDRVADNFRDLAGKYHLFFRLYGLNGVMADLEPVAKAGHELGIVIEAVAEQQQEANTICSFARSTMLHYGYPGRMATAGNLAFPYSPSDFKAGEVYQFSVHHLIEVKDPAELFPVRMEQV
jgi:hypothetical protein